MLASPMWFRFATMASLIELVVSGCATPSNYQPHTERLSIPEIGKEVTASVGDRMLLQGTSTLTKGVSLSEEDNIGSYKFSPGFYPQTGEDNNFTYHSFLVGSSFGGLGALRGAIAVESLRADKRKQQLCVMSTLRAYALGMKPCDTQHTFQRTERPIVGTNNFQQSLIYSGRVKDQIKIGYREFSGDIARPAYSNEVEYDLSASDTINYKGAKIKVIKADNEGITYTVISNFNTTDQ